MVDLLEHSGWSSETFNQRVGLPARRAVAPLSAAKGIHEAWLVHEGWRQGDQVQRGVRLKSKVRIGPFVVAFQPSIESQCGRLADSDRVPESRISRSAYAALRRINTFCHADSHTSHLQDGRIGLTSAKRIHVGDTEAVIDRA